MKFPKLTYAQAVRKLADAAEALFLLKHSGRSLGLRHDVVAP